MILVESIAAGIVAVALLWLVLQPIFAPDTVVPIDDEAPDPEETPRGQALLALKEIEFDRATGKLSETDYDMLNARYSAAAIATLDAAPAAVGGAVAVACRQHGVRLEPDALFCSLCGAGLVTSSGGCATCHALVPPDARFCPGCGAGVVA